MTIGPERPGRAEVYAREPTVRRTVEVGGSTKSQLLRKLREQSIHMNRSALRLFRDDRFTTSTARHVLDTVELTVRALGFVRGATASQMFAKARRLGLELCPLELGPHLRLAYRDQPEGSFGAPLRQHKAPVGSLTIASEPLDENLSTPKGFYLRRIDGVLWLRGYTADAAHVWSPEDHLVFSLSSRSAERSTSGRRTRIGAGDLSGRDRAVAGR